MLVDFPVSGIMATKSTTDNQVHFQTTFFPFYKMERRENPNEAESTLGKDSYKTINCVLTCSKRVFSSLGFSLHSTRLVVTFWVWILSNGSYLVVGV